MKAYKVEIEKLSADWGRFEGWELIGYYTNEKKANRIAKEKYEKRCTVIQGNTRITPIEIDTEA